MADKPKSQPKPKPKSPKINVVPKGEEKQAEQLRKQRIYP